MQKRASHLLVSFGFILILLVGCSGASPTSEIVAPTLTAIQPTAVPSSTPTEIPSPSPTIPPVLPLTVGTALPQLNTVISSGNVDKIVEIATWTGHECSIFDLDFSPDSQTLASISCDKTLRLWNLTSGSQRANIAQADTLFGTDFSPDGATLAAWFNSATAMALYDVASAGQVRTLEYAGSMTSAAFSPDGKTLATPTLDGLILFWDFTSGEQLSSLKPDLGKISDVSFPIISIKFSPDGKLLASADGDNKIRLWDLGTGTVQRTLDFGKSRIWEMDFSSDGSILMVQTISYDFYALPEENGIKLFEVASGNKLHELKWDAKEYGIISATLSPNAEILVVGFGDGTVTLYDAVSGNELHKLIGHTDAAVVAFSPDGKFIASGSGYEDRTIRLWGIYP